MINHDSFTIMYNTLASTVKHQELLDALLTGLNIRCYMDTGEMLFRNKPLRDGSYVPPDEDDVYLTDNSPNLWVIINELMEDTDDLLDLAEAATELLHDEHTWEEVSEYLMEEDDEGDEHTDEYVITWRTRNSKVVQRYESEPVSSILEAIEAMLGIEIIDFQVK